MSDTVEIAINCKNLTKSEINREIREEVERENNAGNTTIHLSLYNYDYRTFESIIIPNHVIEFDCSYNKITSFDGIKLPPSLEFNCSNNQITSFAGLTLPNLLLEFECSFNKITSFAGLKLDPKSLFKFDCSYNQITSYFVDNGLTGLKLPDSLKEFNCSGNKITSFAGLTLPQSLIEFYCSRNQITSFDGLTLPSSLEYFDCFNNPIEVIQDFEFPPNLTGLYINDNTIFKNPNFNSTLRKRLHNQIEYDLELYTRDKLIFLYFNFDVEFFSQHHGQEHLFYESILSNII
jgi:Leucine-rich repeat (LRR) protein